MVDPVRAARVLGVEEGRRFSPKVLYVYEKQLEEADIIAINKTDAVSPDGIAAVREEFERRYSRARVFAVSARDGNGLDPWFQAVLESADHARTDLSIDYDTYAEGEALLGWLNATIHLSGTPFNGNMWLQDIVGDIQQGLRSASVEVAHLKVTLTSTEAPGELAVVQATRTDSPPEASYQFDAPVETGEMIVNLRAEGDPDVLRLVVRASIAVRADTWGLTATWVHEEHFRPSRPVPMHRVVLS
jgi:hypothetical protein